MKFKFAHNFKNYVILFKNLYKDKNTPRISKILLWAGIGYLILPIDIIPDFVPILGQLDDLVIVSSLFFMAFQFIPKKLYKKHYRLVFDRA